MQISAKEADRIETTITSVPAGTQSLLEIGFSDGRMSSALRGRFPYCVALDLPRRVQDGVFHNRVFGTIASLPFADRSFDAVLCCEVLEHLDPDTLERGRRELQRVARRHILITVPFEQRLANELARCTHCGHISHRSSHVRSFAERDVRMLMPGWTLAAVRPFGSMVKGYAPDWMYRLKFMLAGYAARPWPCDRCQEPSSSAEPGFMGRVVRSMVWRMEARQPQRYPWILSLWSYPAH